MKFLEALQDKVFSSSLKRSNFSLNKLRKIPELPESLDRDFIEYELIGGVVIARIEKSFYTVIEPTLAESEQKNLKIIQRGLLEVINVNEHMNVEEYIENTTRVIIAELDLRLSTKSVEKLLYHIYAKMVGLGKVEPILRDPFVSEITFGGTLSIKHTVYGKLNTDIMLDNAELLLVLRKLALKCNEDLSPLQTELTCSDEQKIIKIAYNPEDVQESTFVIQKKIQTYPTPIKLALSRKISPELLAFLWMLIENNRNIFIIKDTVLLHALSYFVPPHTRVLSNITNYEPNPFTRTFLGNTFGEEDYAFIEDWNSNETNGTLITTIDNIPEDGNIVCYTDNGYVKELKEDGKILFQRKEDKFFHNLEDSSFIASHGNRTILLEEFRLRTQLLVLLIRGNQSPKDFRKIIRVYYDNPVQVLKQAGLL
jgi:hypothetical protein